MKRREQLTFLLLVATLLLTACDRRKEASRSSEDAQTQLAIAGTWGVVISNVEAVVTLRPDGSALGP